MKNHTELLLATPSMCQSRDLLIHVLIDPNLSHSFNVSLVVQMIEIIINELYYYLSEFLHMILNYYVQWVKVENQHPVLRKL